MKYIIVVFLSLFLLPLNIKASELEIKYHCPNQIKANEEFTCEIIGDTTLKVSGLEYQFKLPEYISLVRFEKDKTWEGDEESNLIILYGLEDKTGNFPIGKMFLKATKDITSFDVKTEYLVFSDNNYVDHIVVSKDKSDNVNEVKREDKKKSDRIPRIQTYAIIIVLVLIVLSLSIYLKRRKKE